MSKERAIKAYLKARRASPQLDPVPHPAEYMCRVDFQSYGIDPLVVWQWIERCDYASTDALALALMECLLKNDQKRGSGEVGPNAVVNQLIMWILADTRLKGRAVPWSLWWLMRWQLCGVHPALSRTILDEALRDHLETDVSSVREQAKRAGISRSKAHRMRRRVPP